MSAAPPVITDAAALAAHVGATVTLRGTVANTKIPTILGVDVDADDLRGQLAEATGRLDAETVTQAEIDARTAAHGAYAHRGPGTTYRLVAPDGRGLAAARPIIG